MVPKAVKVCRNDRPDSLNSYISARLALLEECQQTLVGQQLRAAYATTREGSSGCRKFDFTACRTPEALWIEAR